MVDRPLLRRSLGRGKASPGGLLATDLGSRLFALGAYTGEVIKRYRGGAWRANDEDPQHEIYVELVLPDGGVVWPVQRVMKRYANGPEDGIAAFGAALGLPVGAPPATVKRRRVVPVLTLAAVQTCRRSGDAAGTLRSLSGTPLATIDASRIASPVHTVTTIHPRWSLALSLTRQATAASQGRGHALIAWQRR